MKPFTQVTGKVAPFDENNIDTDALLPKQYLKSIKRSGFGVVLFDDRRYLDAGEPGDDHSQRRLNPEFILNTPRYEKAEVLLSRDNFGCGSSREHAVWALVDYGVRVIIASSFADIFYNNSFNNGLLLIDLPIETIDQLMREEQQASDAEPYKLSVDLEANLITTPRGETIPFEIDEFRRHKLLNGLDDIGVTLQYADEIRAFEEKRKQIAPWIFTQHASEPPHYKK